MGLIQAMIMMLLVSGMMLLVLKYASISAKHTADSYLHEQAELYLNSSIEKALLAISAYDRKLHDDCYKSYSDSTPLNYGKKFSVYIKMETYYLLKDSEDIGYCDTSIVTPITTPESHGMVIMDVEVNATIDGVLTKRILRRTLQRP
jgi:hypothetical protein